MTNVLKLPSTINTKDEPYKNEAFEAARVVLGENDILFRKSKVNRRDMKTGMKNGQLKSFDRFKNASRDGLDGQSDTIRCITGASQTLHTFPRLCDKKKKFIRKSVEQFNHSLLSI
uniref:Uncharacterized protein n=1 Tax=Onchocerca volvulus TaxID=6282 RepID=A0A8R1XMT4_ONCVO